MWRMDLILRGKGDIQQTPHCLLISIHPCPVTEWEVRVPKEGDTWSPSWKSVFFPAPGEDRMSLIFRSPPRKVEDRVPSARQLAEGNLEHVQQWVPFCFWQSLYCIWMKEKQGAQNSDGTEWMRRLSVFVTLCNTSYLQCLGENKIRRPIKLLWAPQASAWSLTLQMGSVRVRRENKIVFCKRNKSC